MPLDLIKVRMQIQGQRGMLATTMSSIQTASDVLFKEGIFAFWTGTSPALLRQATYGTMRVGLYVQAKEALGIRDEKKNKPFRTILAGISSGGVSAAICNPTDLIKVRMQASQMAESGIPKHSGVIDATRLIIREGGLRGLYRGVGPTTARAAVVAAAELGSYDEIKAFFLKQGARDGIALHLRTAALAGLVATAASNPFDVVKSRVMSQPVDEKGNGHRYKGMLDCFRKSLASEGVSFLGRGFVANYMNKGPTVILFFVFYEAIQTQFDQILDVAAGS